MLLATGAYFVLAYLHYQSVQTALLHALAAFVLLQVAYVGGIILLAWREQSRIRLNAQVQECDDLRELC